MYVLCQVDKLRAKCRCKIISEHSLCSHFRSRMLALGIVTKLLLREHGRPTRTVSRGGQRMFHRGTQQVRQTRIVLLNRNLGAAPFSAIIMKASAIVRFQGCESWLGSLRHGSSSFGSPGAVAQGKSPSVTTRRPAPSSSQTNRPCSSI